MCVVLSHCIYGNLLQQSQVTHTATQQSSQWNPGVSDFGITVHSISMEAPVPIFTSAALDLLAV